MSVSSHIYAHRVERLARRLAKRGITLDGEALDALACRLNLGGSVGGDGPLTLRQRVSFYRLVARLSLARRRGEL